MELAFEGPIVPVYSPEILDEYREELSRPKFHFPADLLDDVLEDIESRGICGSANILHSFILIH